MSDSLLQLAIFGCGRNAREHAQTFRAMAGVRLRAYWNRPDDFHLAEAMLRDFGGAYCTDDYRRVADDPAVDAIYICTMHNDRLRLLDAAARAGKPVFMEKPLALPAELLREMADVLRRHPILFQSGFKIRFHSLVGRAAALLPNPEILVAHVLDDPWPPGDLNDPAISGGNVRAQGVYAADALQILAGSLPVAVTASARNARQPSGVEDTLCATFEFASGALGCLAVADAGNGPGAISKFLVEAAGGGTSLALFSRFTRLQVREADGRETTIIGEEDGFLRQSAAFIAAVRAGGPSPNPFLQGAIPSIMIARALDAAASGCRERIDVHAWLAPAATSAGR
ncbi:MAG TPA: Gfo/Idh/MocA family oxidoreductase [Armatimonadota bacterium]|nr:Gfo/Idh/MocA family oxidoreductase [Armatimonadota bacterium]